MNVYKLFLNLLFVLLANFAFSQRGIVQGTMLDNNGEPLIGMNILIKGNQQGTITDMDGNYRIECNVGDVLVFSYIGLTTQQKTVSLDMFKIVVDPTAPEKTVQAPQLPIKSKAYADLIKKNKADSENFIDMNYKPYKWKYNNSRNSYLYQQNFKDLRVTDSVFEFVTGPYPIFYEIEFSSYTTVKTAVEMPALQNEYTQGRPAAGVNTWFGADNNEIFAWGPKISDMVFDGSNYLYDKNGRLIAKNQSNTLPANAYNPYDIFENGLLLKNSIILRTIWRKISFDFIYDRRNEKGILNTVNVLSDAFEFNSKVKFDRHSIKAGFSYFSENDKYANINGLWSNTISAIMLTPPSFDNTQGYLFPNHEQRSSAPDFNNNPFFLLNKSDSRQQNKTISGQASYDVDIDNTDLGISINYSNNLYNDLFYMPLNSIGFENSYNQEKRIDKSNLNIQINGVNTRFSRLQMKSSIFMNSEKLNYLRTIEATDDLNVEKNRNSWQWVQAVNYRPQFLRFNNSVLIIKNAVYIAQGQQKWLLPYLGINYNLNDLYHRYIEMINDLNIWFNYARSVAELPLYFADKSHNTLPLNLGQINSLLENQELFYDKNLDLEIRNSYHFGFRARGNINWRNFSYNLEFEYNQNFSDNSIFPIQKGSSFELQNLAKIRTETYNTSLKLMIGGYHKTRWESTIVFSKSNPEVLELKNSYTQVPIAGFQQVSKNLIVGQPVGVIVGSVYQRNDLGQLVIGTDGYPLVSADKQIIGNPNPDFYLAFENKLIIKNFVVFSILIDYQKGGDIWNGTRNTLSYYGLSQNTAIERQTTNYVFEGVTENGQVNNTPVDYANPANGLNGNRWYKYGNDGVAEDAVEDGSWLRIKEISIAIKPLRSDWKFARSLSIKLFVNNLWIKTKYSGASPLSWLNNYSQAQGLDYFNMPMTREFGLGLSMKI